MEKRFPRVLVISHNVFSKNTSMGKTLNTYFDGWDKDRIAQLYFHKEIPTSDICRNYYQYTDVDALVSVIYRNRTGRILTEKDIKVERKDSVDTGKLTGVYNIGRKRLPSIYFARDTIWRLSAWHSKSLLKWVEEFRPDVIFFASGDYSFSYRIAMCLANHLSLPLVTCCFDDYFINNSNEKRLFGKLWHRSFMKVVHATMKRSSCIFTVNTMMSEAYAAMFGKECPVLYTATQMSKSTDNSQKTSAISYLGGLSLHRDQQLIEIGHKLQELDVPNIPKYVDVYSGETTKLIIENMTEEHGIHFHGSVSQDEVECIIRSSMAVIHTEAFDEESKRRVKYSLSTKIPDNLASGTCMLAFGPVSVASIDYLRRNDAAFVASSEEELKDVIESIYTDDNKRERIIQNALALAAANHSQTSISELVRSVLNKAYYDR